ncbi:hypothetical protein DSUL_20336 [Desulfovibrionales bacterium]
MGYTVVRDAVVDNDIYRENVHRSRDCVELEAYDLAVPGL